MSLKLPLSENHTPVIEWSPIYDNPIICSQYKKFQVNVE